MKLELSNLFLGDDLSDQITYLEKKNYDYKTENSLLKDRFDVIKTDRDNIKNELDHDKQKIRKLEEQLKKVSDDLKASQMELLSANQAVLDIDNKKLDAERTRTLKSYVRGEFFAKIKYDFENVLVANHDFGYTAIFVKLNIMQAHEQKQFKKSITVLIRKELSQKRYECRQNLKPKLQCK